MSLQTARAGAALLIIAVSIISFAPTQAAPPERAATIVAWSPDGRRLAASGTIGTRVYHVNPSTLADDVMLQGPDSVMDYVAWSPDGSKLASANADNSVNVWDSKTGALLHHLLGHSQIVNSVTWSPAGDKIASASDDKTVRIWDVKTGRNVAIIKSWVEFEAVAWSPDGSRIASGSERSNMISIWNSQTGKLISQLPTDTVQYIGNYLFWSADSQKILMLGPKMWTVATGKPVLLDVCPGGTSSAATWSRDGRFYADATLSEEGALICIWDVDGGPQPPIFLPAYELTSLSFSPDDRSIAGSDGQGWLFIWNIATGDRLVMRPGPLVTRDGLERHLHTCVGDDNIHYPPLVRAVHNDQLDTFVKELKQDQSEADNTISPDCVLEMTVWANYLLSRPLPVPTPASKQIG